MYFESNEDAVRVRTDKANFDFSLISLIFSMNINHYSPQPNIIFTELNAIFFVVGVTVYKVTSKLPNLPSGTLQFIYTLPVLSKCHSLLKHLEYFTH